MRLVTACLGFLAGFVGLLPWRSLSFPGAVLGWLAGSVARVRRAHVEDAMRTAGIPDAAGKSRAMYASLGRSALEFLWLAARPRARLIGPGRPVRMDEASAERWRRALAGGRGVVVAASHTGNWDLAACALAQDLELLVVTKHLRVRALDHFWQSTRASRRVLLADAAGALTLARDVLGRGGAVAMMIDQVPDATRRGRVLVADFLGRPALLDRAPATLAAARRAPLVVAAAVRGRDGVHVLHVLDVLDPPPRGTATRGSRAWIDDTTVAASRALDAFVRAHPSQWLWMHRRWKLPLDPGARPATLAAPWAPIRSTSPGAASKVG